MPYRNSNSIVGRRAHEAVTIQQADNLYAVEGLDWTVSGDHTKVEGSLIGYPAVWGMVSA